MYYFDYLLSDEERQKLQAAGIEFTEELYGTPAYHRHGVQFNVEYLDRIFELLGLVLDSNGSARLTTPQGVQVQGVYVVGLIPTPTPENPVVWHVNGRQQETYLFDDFVPELRHGLLVRSFEYERTAHLYRPGVLFVNLFGTPGDGEFAEESGFYDRGYRVWCEELGDEYVVISNDEGVPLAYFRGDSEGGSLWVLFEVANFRDMPLLDYVLYSVARLMHANLGSAMSFKEYRAVSSRLRYIRLAGKRLREEQESIDERVEIADRRIQEARESLVGALRNSAAAKRRREVLAGGDLEEMVREIQNRLSQEFDNLMCSPDFESIEFGENNVSARTRPIKIVHGGVVYEMGRYDISISSGGSILFSSVDATRGRRSDRHNWVCHPQGYADGRVCFGNASGVVSKMQAEMQWDQLLPFLVIFLETGFNPADHEVHIQEFVDVVQHPEEEEVTEDATDSSGE